LFKNAIAEAGTLGNVLSMSWC